MLDFLYRNAALVAIVLISGAMLLWPMLTRKKRGKEVDSTIATELINHKDAQVIDIRSSDDYKAGHIARSRNFPATVIHHHLNEFDKTKPVLLISAAGDATMVASLLKGMGFASVTVLKGGMKGWREAGLPVVK